MENKRTTVGIPKYSICSGIRRNYLQQYLLSIVGCGVKKIHTLHSNIFIRNFASDKDISMELGESLVPKEKDVCSLLNLYEESYDPENKLKLTYAKVFTLDNITAGFNLVKNKKSVGIDNELKSDITINKLKKLHKDLKTQRYRPKPSRRIAINKPNGGKRYLGIASTIDKVVQMILHQHLTPIFEPIFSEDSYGFRPELGCHDALFKIRHG